MSASQAAVAEPIVRPAPKKNLTAKNKDPKPKQPPRYHVVLWDDPVHTFTYVIEMMQKLFHHSELDANRIANEVNNRGRAICCTTSKEVAELRRDQIHGYGNDPYASRPCGSMAASIEPAAS